MIRYDAMHGYDATDSKVIFINSTVLEESESRTKYVRHLCRWIETTVSESGGIGMSISTAQAADVFNTGDVHNAVNIELTGAGEYGGLYSAIRQRVETLECQMRDLTTNMCSQNHCKLGSVLAHCCSPDTNLVSNLRNTCQEQACR
jgi:hypothetical protein